MTPQRLLPLSAVLACLSLAAPAAADDFGGVSPGTYSEDGGGILAPTPEPSASAAAVEAEPVAEPAQEETPTTPEGEEQPEGEENGEQTPTEENGGEEGSEAVDLPSDAGGGESGSLPRTGLELLALTSIGLGLLLAGGALWPTSSWPPPRDRLSRSTPRR